MGTKRNSQRNMGISSGRRLLRRPRHSWEDNINTYIKEIVWEFWGQDSPDLG
jgi:hypothetical protein